MRIFSLASAISLATVAAGAEPTIEDACLRAAEHYFQVENLEMSKVQSFPELSPPRVRMHISGQGLPTFGLDKIAALLDAKPDDAPNGLEAASTIGPVVCKFESSAPPFALTYFDCAGMACLPTKQRLEELQTLLGREGL